MLAKMHMTEVGGEKEDRPILGWESAWIGKVGPDPGKMIFWGSAHYLVEGDDKDSVIGDQHNK